jgi:hypothetical protein
MPLGVEETAVLWESLFPQGVAGGQCEFSHTS